MFKNVVNARWFAWFDLGCVAAALILLQTAPALGGWSLGLAVIPWLLRLLAGRYPFRTTWFAFPLMIFLMTAVVGARISYDSNGALHKLWQLTGAVFLFLSLAGQPMRNSLLLAGLASFLGVGLALYFSLTNNWVQEPGGLGFMNQVGLWLMEFRPSLQLPGIPHNFTAGVIAWSSPFLIALASGFQRANKNRLLALAAIGGLILAFGFALAFSRGTAIALGCGLLVWITWLSAGKLTSVSTKQKKVVFYLTIGIIGILLVGASWLGLGAYNPTVFSAAQDPMTRLELADSALKLAGDAPLAGSGLSAFSGFYSTYYRGIPFFFFSTSLNQYIDVLFEQGLLGFLCYIMVYLGCLWLLVTRKPQAAYRPLWMGGVIGLTIACVQGFSASPFYSDPGSLIAFLPPGLAYSMAAGLGENKPQFGLGKIFSHRIFQSRCLFPGATVTAVTMAGIVIGILWFKWPSVQSIWLANLGVLEMAKVELAGFPINKLQVKVHQEELQPARDLFLRSLIADPGNRTANHRLGLLAMNDMEYTKAAAYLEAAYQAEPNHRGVVKALGYAYVWMGELAKAEPFLKRIPEAREDLWVYNWWWGTQGRDDLAQRAAAEAQLLGN